MARTQGSHSDVTRRRLFEAAERLFAQHGYAAVSMRKIAGEVGVQAGALYNYTPDKQALLFDLMRQHMDDLLAARSAQEPAGNALDALEQFTRFHIRFHLERPNAVFIAYMELRNLSGRNFAEIEQLRGRYEDELAMILQDGQEAGVFEIADLRITTRAVIAMLTGVTTWYRTDGVLSRAYVEEVYWTMVRKAVLA